MDIDEGNCDVGDSFLVAVEGEFSPNVDEHLKPHIGMTFETLEKAENFYVMYARCGGFQVRKGSNKYKGSEVVDKTFICNKAGVSGSKSNDVRRGTTSRTDCKALVRVKLNKEENSWLLYSFHEVHNHVFTSPGRRHLLPRNRNVSTSHKIVMDQLSQANIPTCKQMIFFESSSGGHNRVGFTETDARNYERDLREAMKGHDGQMLIDFFKWQKEKDSSFFYDFEQDESGRLSHCIWVDGIARVNYENFGEVVSFDATHSTNRYGMLFVPFVGINHHWQSVFLGCGFIPNEQASSFVWLFKKWLEVMKHPPLGMVTDQDRGIGAAIKIVFPQIRHRYCVWHILDKLPTEVPKMVHNDKFMLAFKENVWNSDNCIVFEEKWRSILKEYDSENNKWLNNIYEIRHKWAPVYHRSQFWAGMSSSQRSEGMNAFLKIHVAKKYSLHEFALIFERVLARQREEELKENHRTLEKKPKLKTIWPMEEQMAQVYTLVIFYIFQNELHSSLLHNVTLVQENENEAIYQVNFCGKSESTKVVNFSKMNQMATCSCSMFEFKGIPCKHLLAFFKYSNYNDEVPKQYILRRWSRDVIRKNNTFTNGRNIEEGTTENFASRYCELSTLAKQMVDLGLSSNEAYEVVRDNMSKTIETIRLLQPRSSGEELDRDDRLAEISQISVEEPRQCNTKGRSSGKRMIPISERVKGKPRRCNSCGMRGQKHDSRNCPKKINSDTIAQVASASGNTSEDTSEDVD